MMVPIETSVTIKVPNEVDHPNSSEITGNNAPKSV